EAWSSRWLAMGFSRIWATFGHLSEWWRNTILQWQGGRGDLSAVFLFRKERSEMRMRMSEKHRNADPIFVFISEVVFVLFCFVSFVFSCFLFTFFSSLQSLKKDTRISDCYFCSISDEEEIKSSVSFSLSFLFHLPSPSPSLSPLNGHTVF